MNENEMDQLREKILAENPDVGPLLETLLRTELLVQNHEQLFSKMGQIITDLILRMTALERVLVSKNIFVDKEYEGVLAGAAKQMTDLVEETLNKENNKDKNEEESK